jgi:glycosyltransferase involved in cell wall biosynthesis
MNPEKFVYIPNGVVVDQELHQQSKESLSLNEVPENTFVVGYAGTLGYTNALHHFIDAARIFYNKNITNVSFVLIGNGGEKENLKQVAKGLNNTFFIDAVPKQEIPNVLKKFDVCYIGLRNEPLFRFGVSPNKLFDYMMAAKPIIYAIESANKPVEDAGCGITIQPENPEEIANAIFQLQNLEAQQRDEMGKKGKEYVMKNHGYDKLAQKLLQLIP